MFGKQDSLYGCGCHALGMHDPKCPIWGYGVCQGDIDGVHVHIVVGQSGQYRLEWSLDGTEILRDERPWQMR